jgi:hypothetical protein
MSTVVRPKFKIGDKVRWSSQAAGSWVEKTGIIVAVLPPGVPPMKNFGEGPIYDMARQHNANIQAGGLQSRTMESYIVLVAGKTPKSKSKLYWPLTSALWPVPTPAAHTG